MIGDFGDITLFILLDNEVDIDNIEHGDVQDGEKPFHTFSDIPNCATVWFRRYNCGTCITVKRICNHQQSICEPDC